MNVLKNTFKVLNSKLKTKLVADHETRQNSNRRDEEAAALNEDTPLLNRFPRFEVDGLRRCSPYTVVIVLGLATMLTLGVVIGIDLLVILYNSGKSLGLRDET